MTRRTGLTLMEVLVTLFILAFGVMAILTLFPLAASQMFIAVREDRSALAAHSADGFFRAYWKSEVVDRNRDGQPILEDFYAALSDPHAAAGAGCDGDSQVGPAGEDTDLPGPRGRPAVPARVRTGRCCRAGGVVDVPGGGHVRFLPLIIWVRPGRRG